MCPLTSPYPFSAVVGLPDLRLALLLTAVSPAIGGVLVRGEKGTAKSTVVRGLATLLPEVDVVAGCRFACDPAAPDPSCPDGPHSLDAPLSSTVRRRSALVELPVGATEDRVVGTLDLQRALGDGVKAYEPGLLAAAHRGVLYVDEVNLLPDHLVDLLLDAAAMGRAHVERDGVSVKHAARFRPPRRPGPRWCAAAWRTSWTPRRSRPGSSRRTPRSPPGSPPPGAPCPG
jgi:magnesium chelatase subunit D